MGFEAILHNLKGIGVFTIFLSILIIVHEWGHFITAKRLGVTVERFSLGFGKKIFSRIHNGTEFLISMIPLGGYVKMAGDERDECKGTPDEFFSKSVWVRTLIVLNGPIVNFILAYACFVLMFMIGFADEPAKVGELLDGQPAQMSELKVGDEIIAVNSRKIYGWPEFQEKIAQLSTDKVVLDVLRGDKKISVTLNPEIRERANILGQLKLMPSVGIGLYDNEIGVVAPKGLADEAGIREGDKIISIGGKMTKGWSTISKTLNDIKEGPINLTFIRDGNEIAVTINPKTVKKEFLFGVIKKELVVRKLGIGPKQEEKIYRFGPIASLFRGYFKLQEVTVLTYKAVFSMIGGSISAKENVAGPIGIYVLVTSAAELGFSVFLYLLGVVSASLAIFNLLPIIPLDGGHLLLLGIEKIRGKALTPKVDEIVSRVGFSFIILLAMFVFYVDISKLVFK